MNSKDMRLSKTVNKEMKIMDINKLPYTYFEVAELVQHFNGDMNKINNFINGYQKHLYS